MILILDNRDSFVFNLDQVFRSLGAETRVMRSDRITAAEALGLPLEALVLSPGPGRPAEAGCLLSVVGQAPEGLPILGVCLGHQALAQAAGARIRQARQVFHGRTSRIEHDGEGLFEGIESPLTACRYHSLVVEPRDLRDAYVPTAWSRDADGERVLMGMQHREWPRFGLQFHPESFRTEYGQKILARFLGLSSDRKTP
ncbi:MAG: anthranilate synthase component II [Planctomycetota bacterium]